MLRTLALAAWCLAGTIGPASADPVSVAILTAVGGFAAVTPAAVALTTSVLWAIAGIGLQVVSALLLRKGPPQVGGTTGKLQLGGTVPRAFPIGRTVVTQSLVYANTFGSDGKTPNAYLVMVHALSDLPVKGLAEVWVDGTKATWDPDATPQTEGIAIPEFNKGGKDHLWLRFYDGTQTDVDARLYALFGADPDRPYDSDRIGTGIAYVVVTARINRDVFGSFPEFKYILDGIALYDVREDETEGGNGAQSWEAPSTFTEAADNAIVAAYNVVRGIRYADAWFFGGQTVNARQVPVAAWSAAMNECDVLIPLSGGGSERQFRVGGEIRLDMQPADVLEALMNACGGRLAEVGGIYKPWVGAAGTAVYSITDDDILSTEAQTFEPFRSLADQVNAVTAKYIEPKEGWSAKDAPPLFDATLEAEDGGRRNIVDIGFDFVTSGTQAQRLMKAARDVHRRERSHTLPLAPEAFALEPVVDFVAWTSARNGYVNKLFAIEAAQDLDNLNVGVNLREVDPADYDWDETTDEQPIVIAPSPRVEVPSQAIVGWDADPVTVTGDGGRAKPGIRLSWDGTDLDDVEGVEYRVRLLGETTNLVTFGFVPQPEAGAVDITANLNSATAYQASGRFKPFSGRDVSWSSWVNVTTPDVRVDIVDLAERINSNLVLTQNALLSLRQDIEQLGGSVSAIEAVTTTENAQRVERAHRISARVGENEASITTLETVTSDLDASLAALQTEVEANYDSLSASGLLQFQNVASLPTGATSGARMLVKAADSGAFAQAGLEAYAVAGGGGSPDGFVVLVGNRIYRRLAAGGDPILMVDSNGRFITDGIADGAISGRGVINQTTPIRADRNAYNAATDWQTIGSFTLANKVANSSILLQAYIYAKHDSGTLWMPSTPTNLMQLYKVRLARSGTASTPLEFSDQISQVTYSTSGVTYWDRRGAATLAVFDPDTSVSGSQTYEIQVKLIQSYANGYTIAYGGGGYPITTFSAPNAVSSGNGGNLTYEFSVTGFYLELKK